MGHEVKIQETNKAKLKEMMKEYNVETFRNSLDVDAVCVVTPSDTHYDIVKHWLSNSVHVFCEKPLCFSYEQAKELITLAEKKNRILAVGHVFRFTNGAKLFKELCNLIEPKHITMNFLNDKPPRKDSNIMYNLAIHYLDLLDYVGFGKGKISYHSIEKFNGIIRLEYHNCSVYIYVAYSADEKKRIIKLECDGIEIEIDLAVNNNEPLKEELKHFIKCIENNTYPVNYAEAEIIRTLENLR